jgi:hypothetical protein
MIFRRVLLQVTPDTVIKAVVVIEGVVGPVFRISVAITARTTQLQGRLAIRRGQKPAQARQPPQQAAQHAEALNRGRLALGVEVVL